MEVNKEKIWYILQFFFDKGENACQEAEIANGVYGPDTVTANIYCQQLDHLKLAIDQKRPELANGRGIVFHQDNARSHTSVETRQKLRELGWEVLMHPPYSPDPALSDYHLFLALQNFWSDKKLGSREKVVKIDY
ncbi:putative DD34D transposase [Trichonephila clavipes]|nr:putative DD34D transposase [Trichonephila clavipes]